MTIHMSEDWESFIRDRVQSGRYASEAAVLDEALRLLQQRDQEEEADQSKESVTEAMPAWKRVIENMSEVPDEVFDRIPADSSEQLDHYLYGVPKRPTT